MPQNVPAPLLALAREAAQAVESTGDPAQFGGIALYNQRKDERITALPSFASARQAVSSVPFVAERYGSEDEVGDRLVLQFVYNLFPRATTVGVTADARKLWRRFVAELQRPEWTYLAVANLRNFAADRALAEVINLGGGISIRLRSQPALLALGFSTHTLNALQQDAEVDGWGFSQHVICVEVRRPKTPEHFVLTDGSGYQVVQRAMACLRLAGPGDVSVGPVYFGRQVKFDVSGIGGVARSGFRVPVQPGLPPYQLTRQTVRAASGLLPTLAFLEDHGYKKGPGNLDLALRSFASTYDRFPFQNDTKLLDTISGLEALLSTETTELTFKLSFRVAGLLGRTDAERVEIFKGMKAFYDARSKTVHGDVPKEKQQRTHMQVDEAREYLRRLLVASVRLAASAEPPPYDREFFRDGRLDATLQDRRARAVLLKALGT